MYWFQSTFDSITAPKIPTTALVTSTGTSKLLGVVVLVAGELTSKAGMTGILPSAATTAATLGIGNTVDKADRALWSLTVCEKWDAQVTKCFRSALQDFNL